MPTPRRHQVKRAANWAVWSSLRLRASDVTADILYESAVVLAPHPDDETLGCGATIMRKRDAGTPVLVAIASDGGSADLGYHRDVVVRLRAAELAEAGRRLGLAPGDVVQLGFRDGELRAEGARLTDSIRDLLRDRRPDVVYSTSPADPHADHGALGSAALRAVAGTGVRLLTYPVWQWDRPRAWARSVTTTRPVAVRIGRYRDRKRHALAAYRSQLAPDAGGDHDVGLDPAFLGWFLRGPEIFLPGAW